MSNSYLAFSVQLLKKNVLHDFQVQGIMFPDMKIKTEIEIDQIVDLRLALNSLDFALKRLHLLEKDNFPDIVYETDKIRLENAKKAVESLIRNS